MGLQILDRGYTYDSRLVPCCYSDGRVCVDVRSLDSEVRSQISGERAACNTIVTADSLMKDEGIE